MVAMSVIDKLGRKSMLLIGSVGTCVCLAIVSFLFHAGTHEHLLIFPLIGYIAFFAFSQGAVIWVYISEVFPNSGKGAKPGEFHALVNDRNPVMDISAPQCAFRSGAFRLLLKHDGGPVLRRSVRLPRNQGHLAGGHAKEARYRLADWRGFTLFSNGNSERVLSCWGFQITIVFSCVLPSRCSATRL
jgi:hypothetical protein